MPDHPSDHPSVKESFRRAGLSGKVALIFSTWFGAGLIPGAPGTFGSLGAIPLVIVFYCLGALYMNLFLIVIIPFALWASEISRRLLERDDPSEVVIDEVAGLFMALFLLPLSWLSITAGFLLFRIFDIFKPFPIGMIDRRVKGGTGIVLDDILAGIYANICVRVLLIFIG
jgi:phosphatidylglycerophosphatase A